MPVLKVCLCGEPSPTATCADCRRKRHRNRTPRPHYAGNWKHLSARARRAQPWCSSCLTPGTPQNPLTVDHTPAAHTKVAAGKTLTMKDFRDGLLSVECILCNVAKGAARGNHVTRTD